MHYNISLNHHINQIKNEGYSALLRKIRKIINLIFFFPFFILAIPFVIFMRLIKPVLWIRIGFIWAERIGHFAFDVENYLTEKKLGIQPANTLDLFFYAGQPEIPVKPNLKPANKSFDKIVKRNINVQPWFLLLPLYSANKFIMGGSNHTILPASKRIKARDVKLLFDKVGCQISFSDSENIKGREYLKSIGLKNDEKFICLIARDSAYLAKYHSNHDYNYHDYRDTDINDYEEACLFLAEKGYWVFRMGKAVNSSFNVNHQRIIDYANSDNRHDFFDIWLMANCYFCISNGTGLDEISRIFRKPHVYPNYIPIQHIVTYTNCITVPKHLIWKNSNTPLTLREHLSHPYSRADDYFNSNIQIKDLSPSENLDCVKEMEARLNGLYKTNNNDEKLQSQFWEIYKNDKNFSKNNDLIHQNARVGTDFLKGNKSFLD